MQQGHLTFGVIVREGDSLDILLVGDGLPDLFSRVEAIMKEDTV